MKYQLPHAVYTAFDETTKLYTATQMQAAFDAGRAAGLEEAAKEAATLFAHNGSAKSVDAISACICLIRNLAKETP